MRLSHNSVRSPVARSRRNDGSRSSRDADQTGRRVAGTSRSSSKAINAWQNLARPVMLSAQQEAEG